MAPVRVFHTSLYLSLALAVIAIGVAAGDLLPELPFITIFCLLLLAVAYYREGRWELSLRAANIVGLGLGILLGLWALLQMMRPATGLLENLPWPASALPYLAPVLMILIPAKMLRSKHIGDYWTMQGLGLLSIALACAMAMDGVFILIFLAYTICFVWSLLAFHLYREIGPEQSTTARFAGGRWQGTKLALQLSILTGAAAIPLFWATPRSGSQWELALNARGRATTGISEGPVDLNRTGTLEVSDERAFEFRAETPAGEPIVDLPSDVRFRAVSLHVYENGRWVRNQFSFQSADRATSPPLASRDKRSSIPNFGPGTMHIHYVLGARLGRTPPLLDPVAWRTGQLVPAASLFQDGLYRSWVHRHDGAMDGAFSVESGAQYVQAWIAPEQVGLGPVMRLQPSRIDYFSRLPRGLTRLKSFTDRLVERLVSEGKLPSIVLTEIDPDTRLPLPRHHESIARALEQYLATSPDFTYSLELARRDRSIDPTEDFLLNTRSGHCNRFATALVLMLRTQGIPAQLVVGYRGCENRGDGWYDVREEHAHAWAEVMIAADDDALPPVWSIAMGLGAWWPLMRWQMLYGGNLTSVAFELPPDWKPMRWLTLDPTPATGGDDTLGATTLLHAARQKGEAVIRALLLAYNKDSREQAVEALERWLVDDKGGLLIAGVASAVVGLWLLRRHLRRRAAALAAYPEQLRRLVAILTRSGYQWQPGTTAWEYALGAGKALTALPATAPVADVPQRVVAAYYAERYGGLIALADEARELDSSVGRLQSALG